MAAAVEFKTVTKRFGEVTAVGDISFSVATGETIALLGPSGCGKTTILRMIAGFENPDAGAVIIGGQDVTGLKPYQRNVGLLFQHYALFPHMSVAQNIAYGLRHRGHPARDIPARVAAMLELVRLPGFGDRRPDQLSGGQQQRVALARALAIHPSLLLLDEPLSALDAKLRHDLRAELKQVLAAVGSTAIVVTHDQEEAMSLGERIVVMSRGAIMQVGPPNEVYWRPASRFVAEFMGRTNWLRGRFEAGAGGPAFRGTAGWTLPLAEGTIPPPGAVELCLRPESLELAPPGTAPGALPGRILDIVPLGAVRQLTVELTGGERLLVTEPNRADRAHAPGEAIEVRVPREGAVLFPAAA